MTIDLKRLNKSYLKAIGDMLPAGMYIATLVQANVEVSKNGNLQVVWTLEVENPANGQTHIVKKFSQLSDDKMRWFVNHLNMLRPTATKIEDVDAELKSLSGTRIDIKIEYNPGCGYPVPSFLGLISRPSHSGNDSGNEESTELGYFPAF